MAQASSLQKNLDSIARIVSFKLPNSKVILFGSYARGMQNADSDIDICVIVDKLNMRRIEAMHMLRIAFIDEVDMPLDILVFQKDDFEEAAEHPSRIEYAIAREGVEI